MARELIEREPRGLLGVLGLSLVNPLVLVWEFHQVLGVKYKRFNSCLYAILWSWPEKMISGWDKPIA
jgi:hypothetical protein